MLEELIHVAREYESRNIGERAGELRQRHGLRVMPSRGIRIPSRDDSQILYQYAADRRIGDTRRQCFAPLDEGKVHEAPLVFLLHSLAVRSRAVA